MRDGETTTKQASRKRSGPITLAIWGDGLVGRILVLLLRSSGHEARFLPASSSSLQPPSLEGIDLLVLTPTPMLSTERRKALLSSLRDAPEVATIPVLELVEVGASSEEPPEGGRARSESWHTVPWPCKIEKLEQSIALAV